MKHNRHDEQRLERIRGKTRKQLGFPRRERHTWNTRLHGLLSQLHPSTFNLQPSTPIPQ